MLNPGRPTAKFAVLDTFVILSHKEADTSLKRIRTSFSLYAASFSIAFSIVQLDFSVQTHI